MIHVIIVCQKPFLSEAALSGSFTWCVCALLFVYVHTFFTYLFIDYIHLFIDYILVICTHDVMRVLGG